MKTIFLDAFHSFTIEPDRMGVFLASNVRRDSGLKSVFAQLFKHSRPKQGILQRSGAERNQRVPMRTLVTILKRLGHP